MNDRKAYVFGGVCLCFFLASQAFQELVYRLWIPRWYGPQDDLLAYRLPVDQVRAVWIAVGILSLSVPFVVITFRCFRAAPFSSVLGLIFGMGFVFFELSHRSLDFFVVGQTWARQLVQASSEIEREAVLHRFAMWNEIVRGWYFPLLLSYLLCSISFAYATWRAKSAKSWEWLAPLAFILNALRLTGRILSNFAGQHWLDGFNDSLYFPAVFTIVTLLAIWFFLLARDPDLRGNTP
jgi:hypothetical protein